jgi:hypothetical protein
MDWPNQSTNNIPKRSPIARSKTFANPVFRSLFPFLYHVIYNNYLECARTEYDVVLCRLSFVVLIVLYSIRQWSNVESINSSSCKVFSRDEAELGKMVSVLFVFGCQVIYNRNAAKVFFFSIDRESVVVVVVVQRKTQFRSRRNRPQRRDDASWAS